MVFLGRDSELVVGSLLLRSVVTASPGFNQFALLLLCPRGPGGQALFTLMFNLFGLGDPTKVQDSCEHSSTCRGYRGAQTVPP